MLPARAQDSGGIDRLAVIRARPGNRYARAFDLQIRDLIPVVAGARVDWKRCVELAGRAGGIHLLIKG